MSGQSQSLSSFAAAVKHTLFCSGHQDLGLTIIIVLMDMDKIGSRSRVLILVERFCLCETGAVQCLERAISTATIFLPHRLLNTCALFSPSVFLPYTFIKKSEIYIVFYTKNIANKTISSRPIYTLLFFT